MTSGMVLFAIACLIVLEIQHLRWIWWEHWDCRRCRSKNKHCACPGFKWQIWL